MKIAKVNHGKMFPKKKYSLCLCLFTLLLLSCNDEKVVEDPKTEPERGKTTITVEGDVIDPPKDSRSTDPIVYFNGGYATGAGLYNGKDQPTVAAHPSDGYEVDFFYGGPETASSKKYDYASSGSASFQCRLDGVNHYFKCGFKEKKRTLTLSANPSSGGSVSGGGTYKVKQPISISASPASGYTFTGWSVSSGDATIANASSASTTATLQSTNSTLTANFKSTEIPVTISLALNTDMNNSTNAGFTDRYVTLSSNLGSRVSLRIYGSSDTNKIIYPLAVNTGSRVLYDAHDWMAIDYEGNFLEEFCTPSAFDVLIDNITILSGLKDNVNPTMLVFDPFNGKTYTSGNYKITFEVK